MVIEERWKRVLGFEVAVRVAVQQAATDERARAAHMRVVVNGLQAAGICRAHLPLLAVATYSKIGHDRMVS